MYYELAILRTLATSNCICTYVVCLVIPCSLYVSILNNIYIITKLFALIIKHSAEYIASSQLLYFQS